MITMTAFLVNHQKKKGEKIIENFVTSPKTFKKTNQ